MAILISRSRSTAFHLSHVSPLPSSPLDRVAVPNCRGASLPRCPQLSIAIATARDSASYEGFIFQLRRRNSYRCDVFLVTKELHTGQAAARNRAALGAESGQSEGGSKMRFLKKQMLWTLALAVAGSTAGVVQASAQDHD